MNLNHRHIITHIYHIINIINHSYYMPIILTYQQCKSFLWIIANHMCLNSNWVCDSFIDDASAMSPNFHPFPPQFSLLTFCYRTTNENTRSSSGNVHERRGSHTSAAVFVSPNSQPTLSASTGESSCNSGVCNICYPTRCRTFRSLLIRQHWLANS